MRLPIGYVTAPWPTSNALHPTANPVLASSVTAPTGQTAALLRFAYRFRAHCREHGAMFHDAILDRIRLQKQHSVRVNARSPVSRVLAALALNSVVLALYLLVARPYQLRFGATDAEVQRPMPGDELNRAPTFLATRAITINAAPSVIWPWLLQMGFGRAGYYGYDVLENLGSPSGLHSASAIVPAFQHYVVGDAVPISLAASMQFHDIEPGRYIVWSGFSGGTNGAFTWALEPIDAAHTRLVSRIRWTHHWSQPGMLVLDIFSEFADHIAVRKILVGVRDRVEGQVEPWYVQNVAFTTFVAALLAYIAALIAVLRHPVSVRWLGIGFAAGAVWLAVWYTPLIA